MSEIPYDAEVEAIRKEIRLRQVVSESSPRVAVIGYFIFSSKAMKKEFKRSRIIAEKFRSFEFDTKNTKYKFQKLYSRKVEIIYYGPPAETPSAETPPADLGDPEVAKPERSERSIKDIVRDSDLVIVFRSNWQLVKGVAARTKEAFVYAKKYGKEIIEIDDLFYNKTMYK